jgi:hypothetical protein
LVPFGAKRRADSPVDHRPGKAFGIEQPASPAAPKRERPRERRPKGAFSRPGGHSCDDDSRHAHAARNPSPDAAARSLSAQCRESLRAGHTVHCEPRLTLVAEDRSASARTEATVDGANRQLAANEHVLERGDVPPEHAAAQRPASQPVSGKSAERPERGPAGNAVHDKSFAPLKPPDGSPRLGAENPVDRSVMRSAKAECNLERRDVRRARQGSRRQDESDERAGAYDQPASHPKSRRPLGGEGG